MKKHGRGLSLNGFSLCYGLVTPAERAGLKIDFRVASVDSLPFPGLIRECGFTAPQRVSRGAFLTCYRIAKV